MHHATPVSSEKQDTAAIIVSKLLFYRPEMRIIEEFISNQQEILSMEKDFCRRRRGLHVEDMREIHSGTVVRTSVPEYGGTVVTFHVRGFQEENLKRTLTIGQVIEVR